MKHCVEYLHCTRRIKKASVTEQKHVKDVCMNKTTF